MSDSCGCGSTVDIRALEAGQRRVLMIVLAINIASFVMMITAAIYSGSSSLLSGSLDNLGDALTYLLSLAVIGASLRAKARVALFKGLDRPAFRRHPDAIIHGNDRGVYGQQQAVHG